MIKSVFDDICQLDFLKRLCLIGKIMDSCFLGDRHCYFRLNPRSDFIASKNLIKNKMQNRKKNPT